MKTSSVNPKVDASRFDITSKNNMRRPTNWQTSRIFLVLGTIRRY
jgi:hypothetical protein